MNKFKSIYNVEDINGTNNGKTHYVRMDILNENEYNKIFNAGIICLEGLCLHVYEYLAAPRVLFCAKCNEPGHSKKFCTLKFDRCRRCGKDRNNGELSDCVIICHNCQGDHTASVYKCPTVQRYRCDLIQHIQRHPEALPEHVQLFIPSQFRKQGDRTFNNRLYSHYQQNNTNVKWYNNINANNNDWPPLPPPIQSSIYSNRIREIPYNETIKSLQVQLQELDVKCTVAKDEYDRSNMEIKNKINSSINQIQSLLPCYSIVLQKQNETINILKNSIIECIESNKITNQAVCFMLFKSGEQQCIELSNKLALIPTTERITSIEKLFSTFTPLIDDLLMKLFDVNKHIYINNASQ